VRLALSADRDEVFAIQDEVSEAISMALPVRLALRVKVVNLKAYQHHFKGRFHLLLLSPESLATARACFEPALSVDPD
jgi:hypothetical protein